MHFYYREWSTSGINKFECFKNVARTSYIKLCFSYLQLYNCIFLLILSVSPSKYSIQRKSQNCQPPCCYKHIKPVVHCQSSFPVMYALLFRYPDAASVSSLFREISKQLTLFGTTVKETNRAGYLIYKNPISTYEKIIARFFFGETKVKVLQRKLLFNQPKKNGGEL